MKKNETLLDGLKREIEEETKGLISGQEIENIKHRILQYGPFTDHFIKKTRTSRLKFKVFLFYYLISLDDFETIPNFQEEFEAKKHLKRYNTKNCSEISDLLWIPMADLSSTKLPFFARDIINIQRVLCTKNPDQSLSSTMPF